MPIALYYLYYIVIKSRELRIGTNCSEFNIYSGQVDNPKCPVTKVLLESYDGVIIQIT